MIGKIVEVAAIAAVGVAGVVIYKKRKAIAARWNAAALVRKQRKLETKFLRAYEELAAIGVTPSLLAWDTTNKEAAIGVTPFELAWEPINEE